MLSSVSLANRLAGMLEPSEKRRRAVFGLVTQCVVVSGLQEEIECRGNQRSGEICNNSVVGRTIEWKDFGRNIA